MSQRVVAIVQARIGSTRFHGKILARIGTQTMLTHVLARAKAIPGVHAVAVTTTPRAADDQVVYLCRGAGVRITRGQGPLAIDPRRNDVLAGYAVAAEAERADVIIRLTSDCPLLDSAVAGEVLARFRDVAGCAYASNVHPPTYYDGCDVEVMSRRALAEAATNAAPDEREHVTTYLWRRVAASALGGVNVLTPDGINYAGIKLSVDTAEDLARARRIWEALPRAVRREGAPLTWRAVVAAYREACPTAAGQRARRLYGGRRETTEHRAAYEAGAEAAARRLNALNPYAGGARALATAWQFGFEDTARRISPREDEERRRRDDNPRVRDRG